MYGVLRIRCGLAQINKVVYVATLSTLRAYSRVHLTHIQPRSGKGGRGTWAFFGCKIDGMSMPMPMLIMACRLAGASQASASEDLPASYPPAVNHPLACLACFPP